MIKANHKPFWEFFWYGVSRRMIRRNFHAVNLQSEYRPGDRAVLLIGNHVSWWDGFFGIWANEELFKKKFHVMMLEDELKKRSSFSGAGAFSIQKRSRSALETLKYAGELLGQEKNLVCLFPEGAIRSIYEPRIEMQKGMLRVMKYAKMEFDLVWGAALFDYGSHPKPTLNLYYAPADTANAPELSELESSYNDFYQRCLESQRQFIREQTEG